MCLSGWIFNNELGFISYYTTCEKTRSLTYEIGRIYTTKEISNTYTCNAMLFLYNIQLYYYTTTIITSYTTDHAAGFK